MVTVLLFLERNTERNELSIVNYIRCVPLLNGVSDAFGCVGLQREAESRGKMRVM